MQCCVSFLKEATCNQSTREEYSGGWVLFFLSVARSKPAVTSKQRSCWWQGIHFLLHPMSCSLISSLFGVFFDVSYSTEKIQTWQTRPGREARCWSVLVRGGGCPRASPQRDRGCAEVLGTWRRTRDMEKVQGCGQGLGTWRWTGDVEEDQGHGEGNGGCCVYLHQLQRMHWHPMLGFGRGEGSISRFPVSQDPTDPFLCRLCSVLHRNWGAQPHTCSGQLLGRAAVPEWSRVGPCVPGKSRGFAPLGARLHGHEMSLSQAVTCRWPQPPVHRTRRGSSYPKTKPVSPSAATALGEGLLRLLACPEETTTMIRGLEHLCCEERLRSWGCSAWRREGSGETLSWPLNT